MKNKEQGSIIPAMIVIVLILTSGVGIYFYSEHKKIQKVETDNKEMEKETEVNLEGKYIYDGGSNYTFNLEIKRVGKNDYVFSGIETRLSPLNDDNTRSYMTDKITGQIVLDKSNGGLFRG